MAHLIEFVLLSVVVFNKTCNSPRIAGVISHSSYACVTIKRQVIAEYSQQFFIFSKARFICFEC